MNAEFPPEEAWQEFQRMRKSIRKPMTEYAKKLMLKRLKEMVDKEGQSAQEVLDQSIVNCWQNIYTVKVEQQLQAFSPARLSVVPSTRTGQAWNLSNEGIVAKAKECGLTINRGDSYETIKERVIEYLNDPRRAAR